MIKFIDYINEEILDDIYKKEFIRKSIKTLKDECGPYIRDASDAKRFLGRWIKQEFRGINKIKPRTDRKPTDTPKWLHVYMDKLFFKKFGWKPRSEGVFALAVNKIEYMTSYYPVFPIGEYGYIWSPKVTDLYMTLKDKFDDTYKDSNLKAYLNERDLHMTLKNKFDDRPDHDGTVFKDLKKFPKNSESIKADLDALVDTYKDSDLKAYLNERDNSAREIMIRCESYYLISPNLIKDILPEMWK